jgi:hypothetical protein
MYQRLSVLGSSRVLIRVCRKVCRKKGDLLPYPGEIVLERMAADAEVWRDEECCDT